MAESELSSSPNLAPDAPSSAASAPDALAPDAAATDAPIADVPIVDAPASPPPSYVKLAMRNMVKKGGKSLFHFFLTTLGLAGLLVGLAYLTR
jgi:hypothetical protein